jgi:hypothetical protein
MSLKDALPRALAVYEKEGRHAAPADIVANHMGFKSAGSGASKSALAALSYYGLLDRQGEGVLAVNKSVEEFKFAPSEELRAKLIGQWVRNPAVFAELLAKFSAPLPSRATLKFELIQRGFQPNGADECLDAFLDSYEYALSAGAIGPAGVSSDKDNPTESVACIDQDAQPQGDDKQSPTDTGDGAQDPPKQYGNGTGGNLEIPVRLRGNRIARIIVPSPLYKADKKRLISQIQFLLADDEDDEDDGSDEE